VHVLYQEHQKGQLDAQLLLALAGTVYESGGHIGAHNLEHQGLDVLIVDALDVSVLCLSKELFYRPKGKGTSDTHIGGPVVQGRASHAVEHGKKTFLVG